MSSSSHKNACITSLQKPHGDRAGNPGHLGGERISNRENRGGEVFGVRYGQSGNRENPQGDRPSSFCQVYDFQSVDSDQRGRVGTHEQFDSDHRGAKGRCDDGDGRDPRRRSRFPHEALRSTNA